MRIAMIGPFGLHPNKTMASRAFSLARELVKRGHAVQLFMPPWQTPEEADKSWQKDGVNLRYVSLKGRAPGITRRLIQEALAWQPDVVHCFKPKAYSGLAGWWLWLFHRRRIRLVMDTDDWEGWGGWNDLAPYSSRQKHFFAWQERWGMGHNHMLTVASRALETIALSMGIPAEGVVYVPNGPGISRGAATKGRWEQGSGGDISPLPTVLVYSRLFEFDTERLVAVLQGVKTAVPNLSVLMVGAGLYEDDAAQFRQQLAAAGLTESVIDAGWTEPEALPDLLSSADVGIYLMEDTLLNRTKCPVKLADMAGVGLPVVAEAVGQVNEYVVDGRTGFLRTSGDIKGLTADLIHLLQNPAQRTQMGQAAADHIAANFNWARLAERLEEAYSVIGNR
jgi:glycosyltransferase involved in cell wall biosynthesis